MLFLAARSAAKDNQCNLYETDRDAANLHFSPRFAIRQGGETKKKLQQGARNGVRGDLASAAKSAKCIHHLNNLDIIRTKVLRSPTDHVWNSWLHLRGGAIEKKKSQSLNLKAALFLFSHLNLTFLKQSCVAHCI